MLEEALDIFDDIGPPETRTNHASKSKPSSETKPKKRKSEGSAKAKLKTQFSPLEAVDFEHYCQTTKKWEDVFQKYSDFSKPFIRKQGQALQRAGNWDPMPLPKDPKKEKKEK